MSKPRLHWITALRGVLTFLVTGEALAQTNYLTDLGAVAPALGINNSGQVALQNYIYTNGTLTAFPAGFSAGGEPPVAGEFQAAVVGNVSSSGVIAGTLATDPESIATYSGGTVTLIPTTFQVPAATGVNASGAVVGFGSGSGIDGAFVLSGGTATQLGNNPCGGGNLPSVGAGEALAVNDAGQVVGLEPNYNNGSTTCAQHAFVYENGTLSDLGPGAAYAISANGSATGTYETYSSQGLLSSPVAFLYSNGTATSLPNAVNSFVPVTGYGINSANYIVGIGCCDSAGTGIAHAFFYNGVVLDLTTFLLASDPLQPYVTLTEARGINDTGLVVINGTDSRTNTHHAYLLQVPLLQVTSGPLTFPSTPIGSTSAPMAVTLSNTGTTSLTLGTPTITGPFAIASNSCGASLVALAGCAITVTFSPTAAGTPSGAVTLPAAGVPIAVPLAGSSPLSVSLTSSVAKTVAGVPVKLTWSATTGATCMATGGASGDGWTGTLASSGSKSVTEVAAGAFLYGITCTAGTEMQSAQVGVSVSNPTVTAGISASQTTVPAGTSFTISWSSSYANGCASTGGGSNDTWPSTSRPTSGSVSITEPNPVFSGASEQLTFTITCSSSLGPFSATSSVKVTQLGPTGSGGSGGGEFDPESLLLLLCLFALQRRRRATDPILLKGAEGGRIAFRRLFDPNRSLSWLRSNTAAGKHEVLA
jgi:probable HAF family extracellular repeat protein